MQSCWRLGASTHSCGRGRLLWTMCMMQGAQIWREVMQRAVVAAAAAGIRQLEEGEGVLEVQERRARAVPQQQLLPQLPECFALALLCI